MNGPTQDQIKPITMAQKIFGKNFDNATIINERTASMRSSNSDKDKALFREYKAKLRQQTKVIKMCLR